MSRLHLSAVQLTHLELQEEAREAQLVANMMNLVVIVHDTEKRKALYQSLYWCGDVENPFALCPTWWCIKTRWSRGNHVSESVKIPIRPGRYLTEIQSKLNFPWWVKEARLLNKAMSMACLTALLRSPRAKQLRCFCRPPKSWEQCNHHRQPWCPSLYRLQIFAPVIRKCDVCC